MLEWFINKLAGDKKTERPQASTSYFTPSQVGYQYEPVNLKTLKSQHRKNKLTNYISLVVNKSINKKSVSEIGVFLCLLSSVLLSCAFSILHCVKKTQF